MARDVTSLAQSLHAVLRPRGFRKKGARWNRASGSFVDVIDIQKSQWSFSFTVNCGVFLPSAYTLLWEKQPAKFVSEVSCTVRSRIGGLIDDHDLWWDVKQETIPQDVIDDVVTKVEAYVLPFLDGLHSLKAMEAYLVEKQVAKYGMCPEAIFLAILICQNGRRDEALALMNDLIERDLWAERAGAVVERMRQT